jgi:histone-lysine N-methyltransferase SETMAR
MSRISLPLKYLRHIPHGLTSELKQVRFDLRLQLFLKLRAHAHDNWRHPVTGDESWFYYECLRDRIWTARDENTPEVENKTIASTKTILTFLWNPHGFHVAIRLPPGDSFNASWFIDQNLVPLVQGFFHLAGVQDKKLMVHVDNVPAHNPRMMRTIFEHDQLKRLPHPPYSPDISPSDFYLFGKVTGTLIRQEIPDETSLLDAVTEILNEISTDELQPIFRSWIEPVENIITAERGYTFE